MFTVQYFNEATSDEVIAFIGTLADCEMYVELFKDDGEDLYIVASDEFTVID